MADHIPARLDFMRKRLEDVEKAGLRRSVREFRPCMGARILHEGKELLNFCSNDYLGLNSNPVLQERSLEFMKAYGSGSGASRLVCGDKGYFAGIESKIASFKGKDASIIIGSGFQANISVIPAICTRESLIVMDRLCHSSLVHGAVLSRAEIIRFRHLDLSHLAEVLEKAALKKYDRVLVVTESVFSMDGDITPIGGICEIAHKLGAMIMVDEAHATGIMGEKGSGLCKNHDVDIVMGTFSKALGSYGSYVAGSQLLKEYLMNFCTGFIFSTALPPGVLGAVDAALDIIPGMDSDRKKVADFSQRIRLEFSKMGYDCGASSTQIIPVMVGQAVDATRLSDFLYANGIFASAIRPPTVPRGESRLRFTVTASHTEADIDHLCDAMKRWNRFGV
ncbi:aminotransferase class I/II-fold pyridoxal phosphate-dependent enzyme [Desulforegula conservatrix]|uniref:aminotransferase class I/II-fold pyridoxal phosphate-dependent enzyme n=1 Tax=Desulforegula conservatrix TaxID=153026 RepID=UPI0004085AEB|nr:pyridoxal phosphate-dependent aminotransferase family protein [Desulforegula conservatrix]